MRTPILGCLRSHACNLVDPFEKQYAVKIRNGVVGRPGINMPTIPSMKKNHPKMTNTKRIAMS